MRIRQRFALKGLVTFCVVVCSAFLFRSNQEKRIYAVLDSLITQTQITAAEQPLERIAKARDAAKKFCPEALFELKYPDREEQRIAGRAEIERLMLAARTQLNSLTIILGNRHVTVDGEHAKFTGHVSVTGSMPGAEGQFLEEHDVQISFERREGDWLICEVHGTSTRDVP